MIRLRTSLPLLLVVSLCGACTSSRPVRAEEAGKTAAQLNHFEQTGLIIGEFPVDGANSVVDGDTIRVKGLDSSLRLLGIDTEETFKHDKETRAFRAGWEEYKRAMKGTSKRPVKMATPVGDEAKVWAQNVFEGISQVRLERDHPGEIRDFYGRYLAYVFVARDGRWVNFNVEAVRAGMTPYFQKYGRSRRFHDDFVKAQVEARAAKRGIWDPAKQHYDDYEERLAWWDGRGDAIHQYEQQMQGHDNWFVLTRWDALFNLEKNVGKEIVLLAGVGEVKLGDRGPTVVKLSRTRTSTVDLVFFDKDVFLASNLLNASGEYLQVRGVVQKYKSKHGGPERLQIVVSLPSQVSLAGGPSEAARLGEADEPESE